MNISTRELVLVWITTVVILLGLTYWQGGPRVKEWRESINAMESLANHISVTQRLLDQRTTWEQKLDVLRRKLPRHPVNKEVTAELLKTLERTANKHGLILLRREPSDEEKTGDLYELAIHCTWEGKLDALVHFLYAIQSQGAMLDIRRLTVTPVRKPAEGLKGSFTVDCAYIREAAG